MDIEERLSALGLILPPSPQPGGIYKPVVIMDKWLFVSGQVPVRNDGTFITGKLGEDLDLDQGYQAARQVGLTMLATLKNEIKV